MRGYTTKRTSADDTAVAIDEMEVRMRGRNFEVLSASPSNPSAFGRLLQRVNILLGRKSGKVFRIPSGRRTIRVSDEEMPQLPLLTHMGSLEAADWIRNSMTTFGRNVCSFLPGGFPAYARVYHPFESNRKFSTWREQLAITGRELIDRGDAADFAYHGAVDGQARHGSLAAPIFEALLEHLIPETTTPDECYFAIWEGFGALPPELTPKLELPGRAYHVFSGPLQGALTSFDIMQFERPTSTPHMPANLWWPADHAWCIATEIDFAWTYVGASRACIDAVLADQRLESIETSALSRW
jgi:hypothetical protein